MRNALFLALTIVLAPAVRAEAQLPFLPSGTEYQLSATVDLDRADGEVLKLLDRAKQLQANRAWPEVIDVLVQVMENWGDKLVGVTEHRFISVRDWCHLQLASLPPEALELYRARIDPQAKRLYEEGATRRDSRRLLEVLDRAMASSWGDDALSALGEIALESGDYAAARSYWERIVPFEPPPGAPRTWLSVPNTDLDLAGVRARLVLASILEGSLPRAREELAKFAKLHPETRGRLGGREVNYAAELASLLTQSEQWPPILTSPDWPTFAGSPLRNKIAPALIDVAGIAWRAKLPPPLPEPKAVWGSVAPPRLVADDAAHPLSYHPVVRGDLVLVNTLSEILAFDLNTGKPAWDHDRAAIFEDAFGEDVHRSYLPPDSLGVPRLTMTVVGDRLYARMGPVVTSRAEESRAAAGSGYLVCLDLAAEGRLAWKITPEPGWAFEGAPVADVSNVYVAMRRSDVQPHVYVACYDAQTAQLRWRQSVVAAESRGRGIRNEITHHLLTLHRDTIYYNTNLGAVAALSVRDGRLRWVSLYPRVREVDLMNPAPHWSRDLTPCLYDRGVLFVAPADSRSLFAIEAATGQVLWQAGREAEDVVHLLGVTDDNLIVTGNKLLWISLKEGEQGRVRHVWPDGPEKLGHGRGILAGDCVLWPTREKILVFDQRTAKLQREIPLVPRGVTGGNLLVVRGRLLMATSEELMAFDVVGTTPKAEESVLSFNAHAAERK